MKEPRRDGRPLQKSKQRKITTRGTYTIPNETEFRDLRCKRQSYGVYDWKLDHWEDFSAITKVSKWVSEYFMNGLGNETIFVTHITLLSLSISRRRSQTNVHIYVYLFYNFTLIFNVKNDVWSPIDRRWTSEKTFVLI